MVLFRTNNVLHIFCVLEQAKRSSVSHRVSSDESKTVGSFHWPTLLKNNNARFDHAILKKARAVATESDHPLSTFFHVLPSRRRYRCIKCKTSRYSRSFVPVAIRRLNAK